MKSAMAERRNEEVLSSHNGQHTRSRKVFIPRADVYETEETIVVLTDMPGVNNSSTDVTLEKNILTIQGFTAPQVEENLPLVYCESSEGNYRRVFTLSEEIERDAIQATVKNGVLKLVLPKSAKAKAQKIKVQSE